MTIYELEFDSFRSFTARLAPVLEEDAAPGSSWDQPRSRFMASVRYDDDQLEKDWLAGARSPSPLGVSCVFVYPLYVNPIESVTSCEL